MSDKPVIAPVAQAIYPVAMRATPDGFLVRGWEDASADPCFSIIACGINERLRAVGAKTFEFCTDCCEGKVEQVMVALARLSANVVGPDGKSFTPSWPSGNAAQQLAYLWWQVSQMSFNWEEVMVVRNTVAVPSEVPSGTVVAGWAVPTLSGELTVMAGAEGSDPMVKYADPAGVDDPVPSYGYRLTVRDGDLDLLDRTVVAVAGDPDPGTQLTYVSCNGSRKVADCRPTDPKDRDDTVIALMLGPRDIEGGGASGKVRWLLTSKALYDPGGIFESAMASTTGAASALEWSQHDDSQLREPASSPMSLSSGRSDMESALTSESLTSGASPVSFARTFPGCPAGNRPTLDSMAGPDGYCGPSSSSSEDSFSSLESVSADTGSWSWTADCHKQLPPSLEGVTVSVNGTEVSLGADAPWDLTPWLRQGLNVITVHPCRDNWYHGPLFLTKSVFEETADSMVVKYRYECYRLWGDLPRPKYREVKADFTVEALFPVIAEAECVPVPDLVRRYREDVVASAPVIAAPNVPLTVTFVPATFFPDLSEPKEHKIRDTGGGGVDFCESYESSEQSSDFPLSESNDEGWTVTHLYEQCGAVPTWATEKVWNGSDRSPAVLTESGQYSFKKSEFTDRFETNMRHVAAVAGTSKYDLTHPLAVPKQNFASCEDCKETLSSSSSPWSLPSSRPSSSRPPPPSFPESTSESSSSSTSTSTLESVPSEPIETVSSTSGIIQPETSSSSSSSTSESLTSLASGSLTSESLTSESLTSEIVSGSSLSGPPVTESSTSESLTSGSSLSGPPVTESSTSESLTSESLTSESLTSGSSLSGPVIPPDEFSSSSGSGSSGSGSSVSGSSVSEASGGIVPHSSSTSSSQSSGLQCDFVIEGVTLTDSYSGYFTVRNVGQLPLTVLDVFDQFGASFGSQTYLPGAVVQPGGACVVVVYNNPPQDIRATTFSVVTTCGTKSSTWNACQDPEFLDAALSGDDGTFTYSNVGLSTHTILSVSKKVGASWVPQSTDIVNPDVAGNSVLAVTVYGVTPSALFRVDWRCEGVDRYLSGVWPAS